MSAIIFQFLQNHNFMKKRKDITGYRFGRLVALHSIGKYRGTYQWLCKCDCGQNKIAIVSALCSKKIQSCGCLQKEWRSKFNHNILKDLTGKIFNRLTVMSYVGINNHKKSVWECLCNCGNITQVTANNLLRKNSQSCGCLIREITSRCRTRNLIGQKFGKLTVISKSKKNSAGNYTWICKCDCGGVIIPTSSNIIGKN